VVFQIFWSEDLHPDIFEDNSTGGPDFCCRSAANEFLVEVASLDSAAVAKRSQLPLRIGFGCLEDVKKSISKFAVNSALKQSL
jgi:hypothetical protein